MQEPDRLIHDNRLFPQVNRVNKVRLLLRLYSAAKGGKCLINLELLIPSDLDEIDVVEAASYLEKGGLIVIKTSNRRGLQTRLYLGLTHQGIVEVKRLSKPATKQIMHIFNEYKNCVVHIAANDSSITTQNFGVKTAEVSLLIKELRKSFQSLPDREQPKALKVVDALDKEIKKEHPRRDKLKSLLSQLGGVAFTTGTQTLVLEITKRILGQWLP